MSLDMLRKVSPSNDISEMLERDIVTIRKNSKDCYERVYKKILDDIADKHSKNKFHTIVKIEPEFGTFDECKKLIVEKLKKEKFDTCFVDIRLNPGNSDSHNHIYVNWENKISRYYLKSRN